jgi:hypothetical protein
VDLDEEALIAHMVAAILSVPEADHWLPDLLKCLCRLGMLLLQYLPQPQLPNFKFPSNKPRMPAKPTVIK